jgi:hypothetical protein
MHRATTAGELVICDAEFHAGSKSSYTVTLTAFSRAGRNLPHFELRPEGWLQKLGEKLGLRDIDFDTHADLSRKWQLSAKDEADVRAWFSPGVLSYLETVDTSRRGGSREPANGCWSGARED